MYRFHRYNLIRWDISSPSVAYKLFVRGLYDYVIVKEGTSSGVTTRGYFVAAKGLETSWNNRASLTYSSDIKGRKLVNEGQNWLAAAGRTFTGLLDTYGGAAAAYSLRLLSTDYAGNAVTVRRSSDNQTINIGFVDGELNTGALNTFCSGADGFVTIWYDQSGNGNDVTQTTASNQPKIFDATNGIIEVNGKPAINFEVTNSTPYLNTNLVNYETAFTVAKTETIGVYNYLLYDSVNNLGIGYNVGTSNRGLFYYDSASVRSLPNPDTIRHLGFFDNTNLSVKIAKDGQSFNTFITIKSFAFNSISRNIAALSTNGQVQEIILYGSSQLANRTGIETNINDFYSIY